MKKLISIIIVAITLLSGCAAKGGQEKTKDISDYAVESFVKILDDPGSFELVNLAMIDSTSIRKNIETCRTIDCDADFYKGWKNKEYLKRLALKSALDSAESVFISAGNIDSVVCYTYRIVYRANNLFGAKVLSDSYIQIAPDGNPIKFAGTVEELAIRPGMFPGYEEIYGRK